MTYPPARARALRSALCCSILCTLLPLAAASAETVAVSMTATEDLGELGIAPTDGELRLSLDDAVVIALQRNLSLQVQRLIRRQSLLGIDQNLGIYDFNLGSTLSASNNTSPTTTDLVATGGQAQETDRASLNVSLTRLLSFGGTPGIELNSSRLETNDTFFTVNPSFSADFDLTYTQPLLRDFGKTPTERFLIQARTRTDINREDFETQVTFVLQDIIDRYWELVEARAQLEVARESLKLAEELRENNRIQVEVGTLPPLEMVQSEARVATRQEDIITRTAQVEDTEDRLRRLLNLDQGELWAIPVVPITPAEVAFTEVDVEQAIQTALEERPDIRRKRLENQNLEVEAAYFENQVKPRLDLSARYGFNGVGGDVTTRNMQGEIIDFMPGGLGDAWDQVSERDFDGWAASLVFSYPLENRTAKANRAIADLSVEQGEAELRDLLQDATTQVRRAARAVRTAEQQIKSAKVSVNLEERNLEAEQKRYENGLSTSFRVLEIQEDLSNARSREVTAIAGYRRALVSFYAAIGRLTEEFGVELISD